MFVIRQVFIRRCTIIFLSSTCFPHFYLLDFFLFLFITRTIFLPCGLKKSHTSQHSQHFFNQAVHYDSWRLQKNQQIVFMSIEINKTTVNLIDVRISILMAAYTSLAYNNCYYSSSFFRYLIMSLSFIYVLIFSMFNKFTNNFVDGLDHVTTA